MHGRSLRHGPVFFDLDGTLTDHEAAGRRGLQSMLAGQPAEVLRVAERVWAGVFDEHYGRYLRGECTFADQRVNRVTELAERLGLAEGALSAEAYLEGYQLGWTPYPDVLPALTSLSERPLGIITNGDDDEQRSKLSALGLTPVFPVVISSGATGSAKPDPMIFAAAAAAVGAEPRDCTMIGDDLAKDARGACEAGMRGVWLNRSRAQGEWQDTISSLVELSV